MSLILSRLLLLKELQSTRQKLKMAWQWHRCSVDKQSLQLSWNPRTFDNRSTRRFPCYVYPTCSPCSFLRACCVEYRARTLCSMPDNVKENSSADAGSWDEHIEPLRKEELMALLADPPGAKPARELSEANQQNSFLKRQLMALLADYSRAFKLNQKLDEVNRHNQILKRQLLNEGENVLIYLISQLALLEAEVETILQHSRIKSREIIKLRIPEGSRSSCAALCRQHSWIKSREIIESRIREGSRGGNGKCKSYLSLQEKKGNDFESYILPCVSSSLAVIIEKLKEVREAIIAELQLKKVALTWYGMAKHVKVMGLFNDWSDEAEELLPEEDTDLGKKFSATLMLRPGRYEIIFVVDDEFQLSQELPIVGEGKASNNLLVVE